MVTDADVDPDAAGVPEDIINATRLATIAAAATLTLLAISGTALALGTDDATPPPGAAATPVAGVDADEAATTALGSTGGGQVTGIEREVEHGRMEWKVDVTRDGARHDVRVDATSGAVTRHETEAGDDRGHGRGSDDGPGHDAGDDHRGDREHGGGGR